jgi:hypothetical protein
VSGPYREPGALVRTEGVWRHPTWCENRLNGCHCIECPGDWTGTGRESSSCNAPRPARWWRRLVCRLRGRHKVVTHGCVVSCSTCLRILENPLEPLATRRYPQLGFGGDSVYVEAVIDSTPERQVFALYGENLSPEMHRKLLRIQMNGADVRRCPSGSYCAKALGLDSMRATFWCGACDAKSNVTLVVRSTKGRECCGYVFEDPVEGSTADLAHLDTCRKDHSR